ncbi:hypothetical protein LCGC14_0491660 [marine sediment metagenome]|uniref:Uncharacterized protein n=1 Tax=marine sediment metagenome TaxID=412755 RepID=A0A0F9VF58_9ZZZZ
MLAEILSIVTVGVVIAHLIKDIITDKRQKKLDEQKLQLEQGKAGLDMISKIPEIFKTFLGASLDNPEELKKKLKTFQEAYKDFKIDS